MYLLPKKNEMLKKLKKYVAKIKNKFGRILQTKNNEIDENDGECKSVDVGNFLTEMRIEHFNYNTLSIPE